MPWKGIINRSFSPDEFAQYVDTLSFSTWRPQFVVLHNTGAPTLHQWLSGPTTPQQRILNLQAYYRDQMKWSAGPHLFVDNHLIWAFTPLTTPGVHSPSWNGISWGVEMVGDYGQEDFDQGPGAAVAANAVKALATLHMLIGLDPTTLKFHKEDLGTSHDCPGKNVHKADIIARVQQEMGGDHPLGIGTVSAPAAMASTMASTPIPPPDDPAHPVTVQGNKAIGPDGKSFATVSGNGFVTYGKTPLNDWLKTSPPPADITASMVRAVRAVSLNEGKLEAINSYDNAFLSFGMLQWTAGTGNHPGELAALLDLVQSTDANTFSEYCGRYVLGFSVASATSTTGFLTINGSALRSAADKEQLRRAEWAYRFWRAGQNDTIRRCELVHAARRIDQFYEKVAAGHRVADWLTSEYGVALVLDEHVNRPGHVPGTLNAAIGNLPAGTSAPANWTTVEEEALIQLYIEARNATNMTRPQERAARIADCIHDGTLSDQRGSFVTATATGV